MENKLLFHTPLFDRHFFCCMNILIKVIVVSRWKTECQVTYSYPWWSLLQKDWFLQQLVQWVVIQCRYLLLSDWSIRLVWELWCVGGGLVEGLWRMKILCFLPIILLLENQTMWKEMSASECLLVFFVLLVISILFSFLFKHQCH